MKYFDYTFRKCFTTFHLILLIHRMIHILHDDPDYFHHVLLQKIHDLQKIHNFHDLHRLQLRIHHLIRNLMIELIRDLLCFHILHEYQHDDVLLQTQWVQNLHDHLILNHDHSNQNFERLIYALLTPIRTILQSHVLHHLHGELEHVEH